MKITLSSKIYLFAVGVDEGLFSVVSGRDPAFEVKLHCEKLK
jgi:hypothetical protein